MDTLINPAIITWARERNGLSVEMLADKMKRNPAEIALWEKGSESPTYSVLEELAYKHLKIPVAVFFFPEPPKIEDPRKKFRRLTEYELQRLSYDTIQKIHQGQSFQESLIELTPREKPQKKIFRDLEIRGLTSKQLASAARDFLGVSIEKQFSFRSNEDALKQWRYVIEEAGVYTFKNSFKDYYISGFSLLHDEYPIVYINNSSSFTRQTFTLVHELGHILFGVYGVTDIDETYLQYMSAENRNIEIRCNQFAAEFLVPEQVFEQDLEWFRKKGLDLISEIAEKYSVSREVILRRLLDKGLVSEDIYKKKTSEWNKDYLRARGKKPGGNHYLTKLSYLGEGFTRLAFENFYAKRINTRQLAEYLNIKARHIEKLSSYMRW